MASKVAILKSQVHAAMDLAKTKETELEKVKDEVKQAELFAKKEAEAAQRLRRETALADAAAWDREQLEKTEQKEEEQKKEEKQKEKKQKEKKETEKEEKKGKKENGRKKSNAVVDAYAAKMRRREKALADAAAWDREEAERELLAQDRSTGRLSFESPQKLGAYSHRLHLEQQRQHHERQQRFPLQEQGQGQQEPQAPQEPQGQDSYRGEIRSRLLRRKQQKQQQVRSADGASAASRLTEVAQLRAVLAHSRWERQRGRR
jgi:hypothetical protein